MLMVVVGRGTIRGTRNAAQPSPTTLPHHVTAEPRHCHGSVQGGDKGGGEGPILQTIIFVHTTKVFKVSGSESSPLAFSLSKESRALPAAVP